MTIVKQRDGRHDSKLVRIASSLYKKKLSFNTILKKQDKIIQICYMKIS